MDEESQLVSLILTPAEAKVVVAALRQFEPYWPGDLDDDRRDELLADTRRAIEYVTTSLRTTVS